MGFDVHDKWYLYEIRYIHADMPSLFYFIHSINLMFCDEKADRVDDFQFGDIVNGIFFGG